MSSVDEALEHATLSMTNTYRRIHFPFIALQGCRFMHRAVVLPQRLNSRLHKPEPAVGFSSATAMAKVLLRRGAQESHHRQRDGVR